MVVHRVWGVVPQLCVNCDGYSVHAGVVIGARNRRGREQLCRYIARPLLAKGRLEALLGGWVRIALKRAWSDGTTVLELSRLELGVPLGYAVRRWARATRQGGAARRLVSPPRANQMHTRCGVAWGFGFSNAASETSDP